MIKRNVRTTLGVTCLLLAAFLFWFQPWNYFEQAPDFPAPVIESELKRPPAIEFTGDPEIPVKISVNTDTMKIEGNIVPVGKDKNGNMATTSEPFGVAWYKNGPSPGWPGNAILAGHNTYNGTPGSFANLYTLVPGDEVGFEYADGSKGRFLVKSIETYHVNDAPASVMDIKGDTRVTLIACSGEYVPALGGFSHRVIVLLDPIEQQGSILIETPAGLVRFYRTTLNF